MEYPGFLWRTSLIRRNWITQFDSVIKRTIKWRTLPWAPHMQSAQTLAQLNASHSLDLRLKFSATTGKRNYNCERVGRRHSVTEMLSSSGYPFFKWFDESENKPRSIRSQSDKISRISPQTSIISSRKPDGIRGQKVHESRNGLSDWILEVK